MQEQIKNILKGIIHPETRENIVDSGVVESVSQQGEGVVVTLCFAKAKDPFAQRIKSMVEQIVAAEIPAMEGKVTVVLKQKEPKAPQPKRESTTATVGKIIAVASFYIDKSTEGGSMVTVEDVEFKYYDKITKPSSAYTMTIQCTNSAYGDYMCGCSTNVMYVDDFEWVY